MSAKARTKARIKAKAKARESIRISSIPSLAKARARIKAKARESSRINSIPSLAKAITRVQPCVGGVRSQGTTSVSAFQAYLRQNGQDSQGAHQVQDASVASTSGSASVAASSVPSSAGQYQANAKAKVNRVAYVDLTSFSPSSQVQGRLGAVRLAGESSGSLRLLMAAQLRRQCEST